MNKLSIQKEVSGNVDDICQRVTDAIKPVGFGILTRIDFDQKIYEKLNEKINRCVILGACNPKLAFDAFKQSTDVALLIPCNIVVREIEAGKVIVEAMRPTMMLEFVKGVAKSDSILKAEFDLENVILAL
ncbi:MAG: DUF302 domain-containing protein [Bdellovibrionaceae bacterium]|nr:DUF302 domain-containing protein [Pseudobdellovibrionaceae bacterium]